MNGFGGHAAIAGIGATELSRHAGRRELQLACESIAAALGEAGVAPADVDGLVSYTIDPVEETELVRSAGFREITFSSRVPYGGGGSVGVLLHAAVAVASGACDVVVANRAICARSGATRFGEAKLAPSGRLCTRGRRRRSGAVHSDSSRHAATIYDAFSPLLLMQLEALGFCGWGEAKDFVADGNLAVDGALPTNTNGGLIGDGYIHGLNLVLEATRQLRGTAVNEVPDARAILVTSSRCGAILARA